MQDATTAGATHVVPMDAMALLKSSLGTYKVSEFTQTHTAPLVMKW